jgi:hypothetical protein
MSDDDIVVKIDDDDDAGGRVVRQPAQTAVAESDYDAQAEWRRAHAERAHIETRSIEAQYRTVVSQEEQAQAEAATAKMEYQAANENADYTGATDAHAKLARIEARRARLADTKNELEQRHAEMLAAATSDPVENFARTRTPMTGDWARRHPEWFLDPQKNARLQAAHYGAAAEGIEPDTARYFGFIEKSLGLDGGRSSARRAPAEQSQSRPSNATVYEDGSTVLKVRPGDPIPPNSVRLSKREVEIATDGTLVFEKGPNRGRPIGLAEYCRRRRLMDNDPKWQRMD